MITIFTPSFADEADTNAQNLSVKEIVARLDPRRFAVTLLHEGAPDARIAARPNTHLLQWHKHGNTPRLIAHILAAVPDVYFFPREGPLDAWFLTVRKKLKLKTALVAHVVSGGLYEKPYAPARVKNIEAADLVFANNGYLVELLKEKMGVEAQLIHNGIDRRYFFPPDLRRVLRHRVTVLYAGSMRPYKRVPLVVEQATRRKDVHFRIAGTGEDEGRCKILARQGECSNIQFLGHLSPTQLGEEMRHADLFFFPSVTEGHPQVLGQAAASGLPAVAMKIYRPDYVIDGSTGFLAENDDELAAKLDLLVAQPEKRMSMGRMAIAHSRNFDWDVIADQWQRAFEKAVERRRQH